MNVINRCAIYIWMSFTQAYELELRHPAYEQTHTTFSRYIR